MQAKAAKAREAEERRKREEQVAWVVRVAIESDYDLVWSEQTARSTSDNVQTESQNARILSQTGQTVEGEKEAWSESIQQLRSPQFKVFRSM